MVALDCVRLCVCVYIGEPENHADRPGRHDIQLDGPTQTAYVPTLTYPLFVFVVWLSGTAAHCTQCNADMYRTDKYKRTAGRCCASEDGIPFIHAAVFYELH